MEVMNDGGTIAEKKRRRDKYYCTGGRLERPRDYWGRYEGERRRKGEGPGDIYIYNSVTKKM